MNIRTRFLGTVFAALCLSQPPAGLAATTTANASAFVSGTTVSDSHSTTTGVAQAAAAQVIPSPLGDVFVSAAASSMPGTLSASGSARTAGMAGGFQGQASANWSDAFVIAAPGYEGTATGTFSGAVLVSGSLSLDAFTGRVYEGSEVHVTVDLFPATGYNGGRTTVSGSASTGLGYDIPGGSTGSPDFVLQFTDVPFTFGQRIEVAVDLLVAANVNAIDVGATGRAEADYSHTVTWLGLSAVRDASGNAVQAFSALSPSSGFDFALPTPVPEPATWLLFAAGLGLVGARLIAATPARRGHRCRSWCGRGTVRRSTCSRSPTAVRRACSVTTGSGSCW